MESKDNRLEAWFKASGKSTWYFLGWYEPPSNVKPMKENKRFVYFECPGGIERYTKLTK